MRSWHLVAWVVALAAIAFLLRETFELSAAAGEAEIAARAAKADALAAAEAPPPANAAAPPEDAGAYARVTLELAATKERLAAVEALLAQRNQEAADRAAAAAVPPTMPEGVRSCLSALQAALRGQGFHGPRFLRAERLAGGALEGVEALDGDPEGIDVAFVQAARMTATLDRGKDRFELRFFDGVRTFAGERTALPENGWALVFEGVDGPAIEMALPFLVRAEGVYPEAPPRGSKPASDVDGAVRRQWLERFDRVLADSGMDPRFRVNRFRGMQDGWFLTAELVGIDDKARVVGGAHCERFAVEIDESSGVVSLLLRSGVLRRGARESTITAEGFRMLLPNLTPATAREAMLGMVVTK
jgi:hypothetical protein